ncbi:alpha/beta-hydrolase [Auriscalpium vulgare]|uniref:Alpha/beta-hydrolase n=1 Tax=Auriscalpium vulgare TaxID=40419 RepID=A0ACB8RFH7_9AGAM|nr:alpha/beta-hydrolase [Auriscalpium vulgare]
MTLSKAPYGTWKSPITADALVQKSISLTDVLVDAVTRVVYHIEKRPSEGGRAVIVDTVAGADVIGAGWNATTRVQEYGGGSALVHDGVVFFSHAPDGRVYRTQAGKEPKAVTPAGVPFRYADFDVHPVHKHILVAVLEDHTNDTPSTVLTRLSIINTLTQSLTTVVEGADFYAAPKFSPDGSCIAYQEWNHPDMPWQRSAVHVATIFIPDDGSSTGITLGDDVPLAWDDKEVSVAFPRWLNSDTLIFMCDHSGFQNPWVYSMSSKKRSLLLAPLGEDFNLPANKLGASYYDVLDEDTILFSAFTSGKSVLYHYNIPLKTLTPVENSFVTMSSIRALDPTTIVCVAGSSKEPNGVVRLTLSDTSASPVKTRAEVLKSSMVSLPFPDGVISQPIPLTLQEDGKPLYVIFYPPTNPDYEGSDSPTEKPPCIVNAHGGPTYMADQSLEWTKQYFTSRGWAWLDVNYAGSCGYGRRYIDRLNGQWGIADVSDCAVAATRLAASPHSLVDATRTAIRGGSAGGYTTLAALCAYPDAFAAGTSLYGISDLIKLTEDTHKFESKYMDKLLGGTYEEIPHVYAERSPVNNAEKIRVPLLILQGLDDKVVPPAQAAIIIEKIRSQGGHVEDIQFEGEGHGWVKADTIKTALEAERRFYEKVFKIV